MESPFPTSISAPLLSRRDSTMSNSGGASHIIITCAAKNLFKGPTRVSPPSDWSIVELLKITETAVLDLLSTRGYRVVTMTSGGGDFENLKYVWVLSKENDSSS
ncbi:hypothetical protein QR680_003578 [Steinernema hermaphroditum]|uniref:GTP cyclohydrolase 1 feedback regulatory protein n=1 Tax=Steinernema hermaphroditum TaxID=289476 RepID=A0AA39LSL0_9BILA|nr:hypothetical protein QR680_003578 [Steinernema hermaphroditum]